MHITQTWLCVIWPSTSCNLITRVLTVCHVKLTQNTALQQKCFDLQSLSPALPNLWLLLVINMIFRLSKVRRVRDQLLEAVWDKHRGFLQLISFTPEDFLTWYHGITGQTEDYVIRGKKKLQRNPTYPKQHSGPLGLSNHWEWFSLWIFSLGSWKSLSSRTAQTHRHYKTLIIDYQLQI